MARTSQSKTVVILGGTGFLGPHLVSFFLSAGHRVVIFNRGTRRVALPTGVEHILGSFDRIATFRDRFSSIHPDVVVVMRPLSDTDTLPIVRTFHDFCPRLVLLSSQDVYRAFGIMCDFEHGEAGSSPITEESALRERLYLYGNAPDPSLRNYEKILAEKTALDDEKISSTILRLPLIYGPGDKQFRLHHIVRRMDAGRPYFVLPVENAEARFSRGYVENVCAAIALAALDPRAAGRIFNVTEHNYTTYEWLLNIAHVMQWNGKIYLLSSEASSRDNEATKPIQFVVDSSRIRKELDYREHVPLEEGLRRTITWEREQTPRPSPHCDLMDEQEEDRAVETYGLAVS